MSPTRYRFVVAAAIDAGSAERAGDGQPGLLRTLQSIPSVIAGCGSAASNVLERISVRKRFTSHTVDDEEQE